ncbi:MAG: hypothetical protein VX938_10900, partial [Myxococcota bacterium]|nr:hypothetical protein [Myxococcota bacterium]
MRHRSVGLGAVLATLVLLSSGDAVAEFPALKIDDVVIQPDGEVRVHFSLLDARLRQVKGKQLELVTLLQVPEGSRAEPLFSVSADEVEWMSPRAPTEDGDAPTLTVASELEEGLATAVVVAGYAEPSHTRGTLGESIRQGAGLFFKKLGSGGKMNVYWVGDEVQTWVRARGRSRGLTSMTPSLRAECDQWARQDREKSDEETDGEDNELMEGEAHCGLATDATELSKILKGAGFEGYYPHLFGLNAPLCGVPEHGRATGGELKVEDEGDKVGRATGLSGFEMALQTLVREAGPEQRKALVLLGDGRDGYIYPAAECRAYLQRRCREDNKSYSAQRDCMKKGWTRFVVAAQERFRDRVGPWIALAKAAGVRIFSVIHPEAPEDGRERLELLAWRTGGTARISEDANEVVDLYNELVDELNGQHVLTFRDPEALAGEHRAYQLKVRAGGSTFVSGTYGVSIPDVDVSWRGKLSGWKGQAEGRLGKKGV